MIPDRSASTPIAHSLPTGVRTALADLTPPRDPRYYLALPSDIDRMPQGKEKRSALHAVVHAFRGTFGFEETADGTHAAAYLKSVESYRDAAAPESERAAISTLVRTYPEIRAAGRMRQSMGVVCGEALAGLQTEIQAALVWKSLWGTEKQ